MSDQSGPHGRMLSVTDGEVRSMSPTDIVFLFDVDNTLLDNDRVTEDLQQYLECEVGRERQKRYWTIFEQLRVELGYADYLGALQRYRTEYPRDPHLLTVSHFLINYPFADRLYPSALAVIDHVTRWGTAVILSDGDVVFQPRKVERSGLFKAVQGRVLIYIHKERELDDVEQRYPAGHYLLIDDKLRILGREDKMGLTRDHRVSSPGPLCVGAANVGSFSTGGRDHRPHRGFARSRFLVTARLQGPNEMIGCWLVVIG